MSSTSSPIKVGFVGLSSTGWASAALAPALLDPSLKDDYVLTAVSTSNAESAAASATKYSGLTGSAVKSYHGSSASIAADDDVDPLHTWSHSDLVLISVKAPYHKELILPVIEKGKDFFSEWPVGTSLEQTEEIRSEAKRKGVKTFIGFQGRTSGTAQKVKQLIDSGSIGKVLSTTFVGVFASDAGFFAPRHDKHALYALEASNGVTPLIIPAGHQLDTITHILGPLTSVTASGSQIHPLIKLTNNGEETGETFQSQFLDHFTFSGTLESGAYFTFIMHFGGKSFPGRKTLRWEIEGEDGNILVESEAAMGPNLNIASPNIYLNGQKVDVEGVQSGGYDAVGIVTNQWKEYAKGEGVGKYATIDDAVRNRRVLEAVAKSIREGTRVELDLKL